MRDKNKFKFGDLVKWNPTDKDIEGGDCEDVGIVVEVGYGTVRVYNVDCQWAKIEWVGLGDGMVIVADESWDKTHVLARANNV